MLDVVCQVFVTKPRKCKVRCVLLGLYPFSLGLSMKVSGTTIIHYNTLFHMHSQIGILNDNYVELLHLLSLGKTLSLKTTP